MKKLSIIALVLGLLGGCATAPPPMPEPEPCPAPPAVPDYELQYNIGTPGASKLFVATSHDGRDILKVYEGPVATPLPAHFQESLRFQVSADPAKYVFVNVVKYAGGKEYDALMAYTEKPDGWNADMQCGAPSSGTVTCRLFLDKRPPLASAPSGPEYPATPTDSI